MGVARFADGQGKPCPAPRRYELEEAWMNALSRRFITRSVSILLFTFIRLACAPLAARKLVPDAALTLLLPVTSIGLLSAWGIASLKNRAKWKILVPAAAGPLVLFIHVGQLSPVLAAAGRESVLLLPQLFGWLRDEAAMELSAWLAAQAGLFTQITVLEQRTGLWLLDALQGIADNDLTARALIWSSGLWLMAVWSGWQIRGNE